MDTVAAYGVRTGETGSNPIELYLTDRQPATRCPLIN
jgi:hypothetical protein